MDLTEILMDPRGFVERAQAFAADVQREVDRRMAAHPDLADLDDWLDGMYDGTF